MKNTQIAKLTLVIAALALMGTSAGAKELKPKQPTTKPKTAVEKITPVKAESPNVRNTEGTGKDDVTPRVHNLVSGKVKKTNKRTGTK